MARTPREVKLDLDAMEETGEKNPRKKGQLREELIISLEEEVEHLEGLLADKPVTSGVVTISPPPYNTGSLLPDSRESPEWRFIEKCCAEVEPGKAKTNYQRVYAKLTVWRAMRAIHEAVGDGAEWPQWGATGRDDFTGNLLPPEPEAVAAPAEASEAVDGPIRDITEGGMPVSAVPSRDEILGEVTGGDPTSGILSGAEPVHAG